MAIALHDNPVARIGGKAIRGLGRRVERWAETVGDSGLAQDPTFFADDLGWNAIAMGEQYQTNDLRPADRRRVVERARLYYVRDAMSKQAVRLHTVYCVGRGFSIKARDYKNNNPDVGNNRGDTVKGTMRRVGPGMNPGEDQADELSTEAQQIQQEADAFWEHPDNASIFSTEAQTIHSDRLNVDGELFYVLIPPDGGLDDFGDPLPPDDTITRVRIISDCLQIARVIKNPEDDSEVWYYLRQWNEGSTIKKALYPDHHLYFKNRDADGTVRLPKVGGINGGETGRYTIYGGDLDGAEVKTTQFIYHMKINTIGDRGNSLLTPAMDWTKVNRQYLEDRATISRAHAKFAWKRMIKGPASAVASFGRKNVSAASAVTGQAVPALAGSTLTVNQGADWEAVNAQDGGKNAYIESRNFRLMFYAAVGFAEHYFGDGSNGTRATSKSMERPTELMLQAYQTILKGGYEVMFAFHLTAIGRTYDAHSVWVDAPSILEDDTATVVTSILSVVGVLPQFDIDEVILKILSAFSIDDPQDVLVKIRARQRELWEQNYALVLAQSGMDAANAQVTAGDPNGLAALVAAQQKVITAMTPPDDPTRQPGPKSGPQFAQPGTKGGALAIRKPTPAKLRPTDPNNI